MNKSIEQKVFTVLKKHLGVRLFVVFKHHEEGIVMRTGRLLSISGDELTYEDETFQKSKVTLPFYDNDGAFILNVYNSHFIDLLKLQETKHLAYKLRKGDMGQILKRLKPYIGKVLQFIYKPNNQLVTSRGEFSNMGVQDLTLKLAPFYNDVLKIPYMHVLNIYNEEGEDLIG